jgi:hypothetical protein
MKWGSKIMINKKQVAKILKEINFNDEGIRKDNFYAHNQNPKGFLEFFEETYKPLMYAYDEDLFIGNIVTNRINGNQDIEGILINNFGGLTEKGEVFILKHSCCK